MSKIANHVKDINQEIRYRDRIIFALIFLLIFLAFAFFRIPSKIQVYHTPSLESTIATNVNYVPPSAVYSFAVLFWERLNYCRDSCDIDYANNLKESRPFITETCYAELVDHARDNIQLLKNRTRQLTLLDTSIFDHSKVQQLDKDTWIVNESFGFNEAVNGNRLSMREFNMHYPLRIVKNNVSEHINPYGFQLDCFAGSPQRIEVEK